MQIPKQPLPRRPAGALREPTQEPEEAAAGSLMTEMVQGGISLMHACRMSSCPLPQAVVETGAAHSSHVPML